MKSAYYTFTTWDGCEQAAGFDGGLGSGHQAAIVRQPGQKARALGGDNVIDLAAWRAANRELWDEPEELAQKCVPEEAAPELPVRRARRSRRGAYIDPELFSILGVVGVLAVLVIRVLLF